MWMGGRGCRGGANETAGFEGSGSGARGSAQPSQSPPPSAPDVEGRCCAGGCAQSSFSRSQNLRSGLIRHGAGRDAEIRWAGQSWAAEAGPRRWGRRPFAVYVLICEFGLFLRLRRRLIRRFTEIAHYAKADEYPATTHGICSFCDLAGMLPRILRRAALEYNHLQSNAQTDTPSPFASAHVAGLGQ